jgi:hypothetical protein
MKQITFEACSVSIGSGYPSPNDAACVARHRLGDVAGAPAVYILMGGPTRRLRPNQLLITKAQRP